MMTVPRPEPLSGCEIPGRPIVDGPFVQHVVRAAPEREGTSSGALEGAAAFRDKKGRLMFSLKSEALAAST